MLDPVKIDAVAAVAHETNRLYCLAHGDTSQKHWEDTPDNIRASAIDGVYGVMEGITPAETHERWSKFKLADGWKFGPVKNLEEKTHPCLIPYDELTDLQKEKDSLFIAVVRSMLYALHVPYKIDSPSERVIRTMNEDHTVTITPYDV